MFPPTRHVSHPQEFGSPVSLKRTILSTSSQLILQRIYRAYKKTFIDKHEKLRQKCIFPIPSGAISLRSEDGSPLQILGYVRFTLKLGNKSLPVEALVLPHLGPEVMLLDNSIMKSFGAKIDWSSECLSFQNSTQTIPARHVRSSVQSEYCSVITQTVDTPSTPVLVSRKFVIPAALEALIRVFSTARPEKDTLALIEPRIASIHTLDDMPQDDIWQSVIIARTVTQWRSVTNSALLQVGNPSDRTIILKPNTIVGTITPVTAISPQTASAVAQNCSESLQARIDLTAALDASFKNTTFDDQQQAQIINLCTEYRSVFSLNQKELGKCTLAEDEFPLQKDTKPVDRHPYRTNPRALKVIDKCFDDMQEIDIIEKRQSQGGRQCASLQKPMVHHAFAWTTELLLISSLFARHGPCLILSLISTQWVVPISSPFATYKVLIGKSL